MGGDSILQLRQNAFALDDDTTFSIYSPLRKALYIETLLPSDPNLLGKTDDNK